MKNSYERNTTKRKKKIIDKTEQMFYSDEVRTFVPGKRRFQMEKDEKLKALDAAISQIEKQYGKGAVMKLGDPSAPHSYTHLTLPTICSE